MKIHHEYLAALDKQYIWHPFTQMQDWLEEDPIIISRGEGNYLYDTRGNRYLDAISSLWVNVHGHNRAEINQAIIDQVRTISHSTLLGFANEPSILLAKQLIKLAPPGLTKVFYSDSGSTSVEIALKMAYQYWQQQSPPQKSKRTFISFVNAYHGDTIGSVSVGGVEDFHSIYEPLLFETRKVPYPYCYRCEHCQDVLVPCHCIRSLETLLEEQHTTIAGLIIEPLVQGASGMITAPRGFLSNVEALCRRYNILLIVDEVATGFGRTGKMFACEHEQIRPDIMCVAKGLTGGYLPLAATLTSQKVFDAFLGDYQEKRTFFHGHSYTGNQVACSAALANLSIFEQEKITEQLPAKVKCLSQSLDSLAFLDHVGDIRQCGLMVGIELVEDKPSKRDYSWEKRIGVNVCRDMLNKGFLLRPLGNVVVLMPPLSITPEEIISLVDNLKDSIIKITE